MNILILGKNGFIGSSLLEYFTQDKYNVIGLGRENLDLTDSNKVKNYFKQNNNFDIVINCASESGNLNNQTYSNLTNNILIQDNILRFVKYKKLIIFGSGAEYNRENDICKFNEYDFISLPIDFYGLSKYINTQIARNKENIINFRFFGCFGYNELSSRFIKTAIWQYIKKEEITILEDKEFDYFYIYDLYQLIIKILGGIMGNMWKLSQPYIELNCVYKQKYKLSEISNIINNLSNYKVPIKILIKNAPIKNYSASGNLLNQTYGKSIKWTGLELGIKQVYGRFFNWNNSCH